MASAGKVAPAGIDVPAAKVIASGSGVPAGTSVLAARLAAIGRGAPGPHFVPAGSVTGIDRDVPANKVVDFEAGLHAFARANSKHVLDAINAKPEYTDENVAEFRKIVEAFKKTGTY